MAFLPSFRRDTAGCLAEVSHLLKISRKSLFRLHERQLNPGEVFNSIRHPEGIERFLLIVHARVTIIV